MNHERQATNETQTQAKVPQDAAAPTMSRARRTDAGAPCRRDQAVPLLHGAGLPQIGKSRSRAAAAERDFPVGVGRDRQNRKSAALSRLLPLRFKLENFDATTKNQAPQRGRGVDIRTGHRPRQPGRHPLRQRPKRGPRGSAGATGHGSRGLSIVSMRPEGHVGWASQPVRRETQMSNAECLRNDEARSPNCRSMQPRPSDFVTVVTKRSDACQPASIAHRCGGTNRGFPAPSLRAIIGGWTSRNPRFQPNSPLQFMLLP